MFVVRAVEVTTCTRRVRHGYHNRRVASAGRRLPTRRR